MADIAPFRGWRPPAELAARVAAPPYDVIDTAEARQLAAGNPLSLLHVSRPEIDLPPGVDLHADAVYAGGRAALDRLRADGVLQRDPLPCLYVYRQVMGAHGQTGVLAAGAVAEYDDGRIRRHELTRQDKEDDRTRHVDEQDANAEPVFLAYRARPGLEALVAAVTAAPPETDIVAEDGVRHVLWVVPPGARQRALVDAFRGIDVTYVADGHHRSAAASRVAARRRARGAAAGAHERFMAVYFPHDQLQILAYHRVLLDLAGLAPDAFLARVRERFDVASTDEPLPGRPRTFGLLLEGRWYRLATRPDRVDERDPVRRLDVSILQDDLLAPVLGIGDPRTDPRLDFVGGIRGTPELERRCAAGAAAAVALHPTSMDDLFAIADAGAIMPPKSTWFEPKLRSGLVVRTLDE